MKYTKRNKYTPEYISEVKDAVKYFYDNNGNIPMSAVHAKFHHVTYCDIDTAIMEEAHKRALAQRKHFDIIPPEFDKEVELLLEELL